MPYICASQACMSFLGHFKEAVSKSALPGIINILHEYLSQIQWNQPISDEAHLARIAARIDDWQEISSFLKLTAADESAILWE